MALTTTQEGQWQLQYGVHRGKYISRDDATISGLDSLEACKTKIAELEKQVRGFGMYIWYATAKGPNGEEITVHPGTPYSY